MSSLMFVLTFLLLLQNIDNKVTHTKCLVRSWKYNTEANYNHSIQCYLIYEIMQLSFSEVFYNMVCMYQVKRIKKILSGSKTKTAFLFLSLFYSLFHKHEFWPCNEKKKLNRESCHAKSERSHLNISFFYKWQQQQQKRERERKKTQPMFQMYRILKNMNHPHLMHTKAIRCMILSV